jgi:hypothetical protein
MKLIEWLEAAKVLFDDAVLQQKHANVFNAMRAARREAIKIHTFGHEDHWTVKTADGRLLTDRICSTNEQEAQEWLADYPTAKVVKVQRKSIYQEAT